MFGQGTLYQFVVVAEHREDEFFLILKMLYKARPVEMVSIFLDPSNFNAAPKPFSDLPAEQQAVVMLPAEWLQFLDAFLWFHC
jgi:hypothetical protein